MITAELKLHYYRGPALPKAGKNELNEIIISTHNRLAFTIQVGFKILQVYFAYFLTFEAFFMEMPDK